MSLRGGLGRNRDRGEAYWGLEAGAGRGHAAWVGELDDSGCSVSLGDLALLFPEGEVRFGHGVLVTDHIVCDGKKADVDLNLTSDYGSVL